MRNTEIRRLLCQNKDSTMCEGWKSNQTNKQHYVMQKQLLSLSHKQIGQSRDWQHREHHHSLSNRHLGRQNSPLSVTVLCTPLLSMKSYEHEVNPPLVGWGQLSWLHCSQPLVQPAPWGWIWEKEVFLMLSKHWAINLCVISPAPVSTQSIVFFWNISQGQWLHWGSWDGCSYDD